MILDTTSPLVFEELREICLAKSLSYALTSSSTRVSNFPNNSSSRIFGPLIKFPRNAGVHTAMLGDVFECAYGHFPTMFVKEARKIRNMKEDSIQVLLSFSNSQVA
jgi:hypothetical protein